MVVLGFAMGWSVGWSAVRLSTRYHCHVLTTISVIWGGGSIGAQPPLTYQKNSAPNALWFYVRLGDFHGRYTAPLAPSQCLYR